MITPEQKQLLMSLLHEQGREFYNILWDEVNK
jgi:hypothetical protein